MIIFNGAIWRQVIRLTILLSIGGRYKATSCSSAQSGINFSTRMRSETLGRISAFARYLLSL